MPTLEIRPGEGGDDAYRFAREFADAIMRHAERAVIPARLHDAGRSLTLEVGNTAPYAELVGTHRVQRVPRGSKQRHSSTVTLAVLGDVNANVDVVHADVDIDYYRGTGPGGQHKNKTSTAVRLRHRPTGIIVTREKGRSQSTNLAEAWADLERQLTDRAQSKAHAQRNDVRRAQITANRAARSFTHTAWRDEVVCHETGKRWRMSDFLKGRF